jgi:hypothetical protein
MREAFLIEFIPQNNWETGTFKAYKEAHEAYVEQREVAKQAKATLALFTAPTSKAEKVSEKASEKEPAKKSSEKGKASKKTKEGAALSDAPAPELGEEYQALYNKATFAKETAKNKPKAAATKMFRYMQTCCLWMPSTYGTRQSRSRWRLIHSRVFKACQEKAQGGFCLIHSTNKLCSTFSLCFQTTQLSKKNTTFLTCLRSPRGLA